MLSLDMAIIEQGDLLEYLANQYPRALVVLLGNMDEDELDRSVWAGQISGLNMGGFLHKPIDFDAVRSTLERLTKKNRDMAKKPPG